MNEHYILIGEDDSDDRYLIQSAFDENMFNDHLHFLGNGVEIMEHLTEIEQGPSPKRYPRFILLDLNMPKKDGRETLKEIKSHSEFQKIPVIVFSTANSEHEMLKCYELGANSYITKPNSFESLIQTVAAIRSYWLTTSKIPN